MSNETPAPLHRIYRIGPDGVVSTLAGAAGLATVEQIKAMDEAAQGTGYRYTYEAPGEGKEGAGLDLIALVRAYEGATIRFARDPSESNRKAFKKAQSDYRTTMETCPISALNSPEYREMMRNMAPVPPSSTPASVADLERLDELLNMTWRMPVGDKPALAAAHRKRAEAMKEARAIAKSALAAARAALAADPRPSSSQPLAPVNRMHKCLGGEYRAGGSESCVVCCPNPSPESLGGRRLVVQSPDAEDQK